MIKIKAISTGKMESEKLENNKGKIFNSIIIGKLDWSCPFCRKQETFGDHTMQNVFKHRCECGKEYLVEYWHEKDSRS